MPVLLTHFDTAIGGCAIAWDTRGIVSVRLPETTQAETLARLLQRFPEAREAPPPPEVLRARDGITKLLRGEPADLGYIQLDMDFVPPFHRRAYEATRGIPFGATATYGGLAILAGAPGSARAVGQALKRNPFALAVPCHRVLAAGGKTGGFSAHGGTGLKLKLLAIEGQGLGIESVWAKSARGSSSRLAVGGLSCPHG